MNLSFYLFNFLLYSHLQLLRLTSHHFPDLIPIADFSNHRRATILVLYDQEIAVQIALNYKPRDPRRRRSRLQNPDGSSPSPDSMEYPESQAMQGNLLCYHCCRWLFPAKFSAGRSSGPFDLGQWSANTRLCIECGVRARFYQKGQGLGAYASVCLCCGKLYRTSSRFAVEHGFDRICFNCAPDADTYYERIDDYCKQGLIDMYLRYLKGMQKGKEYRANKGETRRKERRIVTVNDEQAKGLLDLCSTGSLVPVVSRLKLDGLCPQSFGRYWRLVEGTFWCCLLPKDRLPDEQKLFKLVHRELQRKREVHKELTHLRRRINVSPGDRIDVRTVQRQINEIQENNRRDEADYWKQLRLAYGMRGGRG